MRIFRNTRALCVMTLVLFVMMVAIEHFYFRRITGGIGSLDFRLFGFNWGEAIAWLNALGPRGREAVIVWHYLTFDLVFPALFAATLASLIHAAGNRLPGYRAMPMRTRKNFAIAVVVPYAMADYVQNFAVARLLADPLSANPGSISTASGMIMIKFVFGLIPIIIIVTLFLAGQRR